MVLMRHQASEAVYLIEKCPILSTTRNPHPGNAESGQFPHLNRMPHHPGFTNPGARSLAGSGSTVGHFLCTPLGQEKIFLSSDLNSWDLECQRSFQRRPFCEWKLCPAPALILPFTPSTEVLLIPSAALSALVEVERLKWHRGRLLRACPAKWKPFNKSLAVNGLSSFWVVCRKPRACAAQSCTVVLLGQQRAARLRLDENPPPPLLSPGPPCVGVIQAGRGKDYGSNGVLCASFQQLFGAGGGWGAVCVGSSEWPPFVKL